MLLIGARSPILAVIDVCAQLVGAITASGIVEVLFPGKLEVTTTLSKETSLAQGVFIEALLTAVLVFTIFMLAAEKHKATFIAPIGIGLALFVCELSGVYFTGGTCHRCADLQMRAMANRRFQGVSIRRVHLAPA